MPCAVEFVGDPGFVLAVFSGNITLDLLTEGRQEMQRCLQESGCDRLLVDAEDFSLAQDMADEYDFVSEHPLHFPATARIAIVAYPETRKHFEFVENVAQNRGTNLRVFPSRDAALEWLL